MTYKPCCIDIYRGDEISDAPSALAGLDRVKLTGVFACIHKASEGTGYRDSRYDARRAKWMSGNPISVTDVDGKALSLSPVWGAYHFFDGASATDEAKNFIMTARLGPHDMPFLDWEEVGASGYQPPIEAADAFCQAVESALGKPCGVYGGNVPRERFDAGRPSDAILERFSARPLWLCGYGSYSPEKLRELIPLPWKEKGIWLWQDDGDKYGPGPHSMPGISDYCDNSTVVDPMTFALLHAQWTGAVTQAPTKPVEKPPVAEAPPAAPGPVKAPEPSREDILGRLADEVKALEAEIEEELKHGA